MLVSLKAAWGYLFGGATPVRVEPVVPVETVVAQPVVPVEELPDTVVPSYTWPAPPQKAVQIHPVPKPIIICSQCRKEIKSANVPAATPDLEVYVCEHCGARVALS